MANLIPARETRRRFGGISAMTEWRWRKSGILPPAVVINGRNYDPEDVIDAKVEAYREQSSGGDNKAA